MKQRYYLLLPITAVLLYILAFLSLIHWSPSNTTATWAWNLGIVLAPVLAVLVQLRLARERGISTALALSVIAVMNTALVLGSRLGAWSTTDWHQALAQGILPALPGKTVMGGLALSLGLFFLLKRWWRLPYAIADVLVMGLPLAAVSGRIGCLVAGCCYGTETGAGFGICYGPGTPAFEHQSAVLGFAPETGFTTPLYPVQLLFIAGNLLIFFLLWHFRKRFSQTGTIALLGLGLLMAQRFGLEFIRDVATNRGELGRYFVGLKWVQWQSLLLAVPAFAALFFLRFFRKGAETSTCVPVQDRRLWPQALVLCLIIGAAFFLQPVMTLDESVVILISCLPALVALGYAIGVQQQPVRQRLASASLLSIGMVLLIGPPSDSLQVKPGPDYWTRWFEVGAGGALGTYTRKVVNQDCGGNVTSVHYEHMNTQFFGGQASANWEKGNNHLKVELTATAGEVSSNDSNQGEDNNQFSAFGLAGRYEGRYFGIGLGAFNHNMNFAPNTQGGALENNYLPMITIRLGRKDLFAVDGKIFDEPRFTQSMETPVSLGMRWGFKDESGDTYIRTGLAVCITGRPAFHIGGEMPFGESGWHGSAVGYIGDMNMISLGLKYRFGERQRY